MRKLEWNRHSNAAGEPTQAARSEPADPTVFISAETITQMIERRRMTTPFLLFLVSHRPLAFVAGQILHMTQPMAELLEIEGFADLAVLLSEPMGLDEVHEALTKT